MLNKKKGLALMGLLLAVLCGGITLAITWNEPAAAAPQVTAAGESGTDAAQYSVLAWNDLGMHCYNASFQDLAVLPPYNTLWAQVVRIGNPPEIVTTGITVTFVFSDNTDSVSKSNFWDASPYRTGQNAQLLFGLSQPLPGNVGLTGTGLSGDMTAHGDHFVAEGIPLTEYRDGDTTTPYPYQVATVIVYDAGTGQELARTHPVAPVSSEMNCDDCHYDDGPGNQGIQTGVVEQNILSKHDDENATEYPPGHETPLMDRRPVLCAECHATNALGAPGVAGIPNLSNAIHEQHKSQVTTDIHGCYKCHPGPQTRCLRDVMNALDGLTCVSVNCHGRMVQVATNPEPWLNEPRCDNTMCHGTRYAQDDPLYRLSRGHSGIYCAACHDSPHAVAPSREDNDAIKFYGWQGHDGPVLKCGLCHAPWPVEEGPHGITFGALYLPVILHPVSR